MSGTLALSSLIASLDRAGLIELIRTRYVASPDSVHDPIDLATELLRPESISRALTMLGRDELVALAGSDEAVDPTAATPLLTKGLLGSGGVKLPEVTRALESALAERGLSAAELSIETSGADASGADDLDAGDSSEGETGASDGIHDTSHWFAAALTTSAQSAWLLRELTRTPGKLNRNGSIASAWVRAHEERNGTPRVDELVELLRSSGLARARGSELHANASQWLALDQDERWLQLARAGVELMPRLVLDLLEQSDGAGTATITPLTQLIASVPASFPLIADATIAQISHAAELWERLGITVAGNFSDAGLRVLRGTGDGPLGLPDPVPGIYIQPDLSVIVPGPLEATDEAELAAITVPEQLGVASTLRISESSLSEAFDRGVTAEQIRGLLERLTLTGIPQPLEYLIGSLEERAGSIVVSMHDGDEGRTKVDFARPELRATVLVDRNLAHLQLHESGDGEGGSTTLYSRLRPDHVLAALVDARYPAAGSISPPAAHEQTSEDAAEPTDASPKHAGDADPAVAVAERVLAAAADGPGDISRQVTLAVRDRSPIRVTVEMRGEVRDFTVVPVSLAAGRVRALDESAGVERTLPLDAITAVTSLR